MASAYTQPTTSLAPLRMSYDEWQEWYGKEERNRGEWVRGEVIPFMPPLLSHGDIVNFLNRLIGNYSDVYGLGRVYVEAAELWLPDSDAARVPDVCFISHEHTDRRTARRLEGYADLVVEVISRDSVSRDRRQKFTEYQTAGIPEYWIVDPRPRRQTVEIYLLDEHGRYQELARERSGRLRSRVLPGFWIDPSWLWQDPLPGPYQLIAQNMADPPEPLP